MWEHEGVARVQMNETGLNARAHDDLACMKAEVCDL